MPPTIQLDTKPTIIAFIPGVHFHHWQATIFFSYESHLLMGRTHGQGENLACLLKGQHGSKEQVG